MKVEAKIGITDEYLDATEFFDVIHSITNKIKNKLGWIRLPRYFLPQTVENRFSGGYISPTAMKSFENCPAHYLWEMIIPESKQSYTYIGTSVHQLLESFYNLPKLDRTERSFKKLREEKIKENDLTGRALEYFNFYADGFWTAPDYIHDSHGNMRSMDHKSLDVETEYFIKERLHPLNINLSYDPKHIDSVMSYNNVDRIDNRNGNIYIIDYKTGIGNATPHSRGRYGYLPQLIFYKWAVEALLGQEIAGAYLMLPGADDNEDKWVPMNVNSLEEQSIVIENVVSYLQDMEKVKKTHLLPILNGPYCKEFPKSHVEVMNGKEYKYLHWEWNLDEREFLENAKENGHIDELPDNIKTLDQWVEYAKANHHLPEKEWMLIDEYKEERKRAEEEIKLDSTDIDW